jgi:heme A synthase
MASAGLRLRTIRATALLLTVLSLMVVLLSAYLRLDGAGLGCADWPACYGRLLASEPGELHFGVVRLLHRAVASISLLLACARWSGSAGAGRRSSRQPVRRRSSCC